MTVAEAVRPFDLVIRGRRSVRSFTDEPVSDAQLIDLIDAARWAPSPHNSQPWRFVVVNDGRVRLAEAMADRWRRDLADHDEIAPAILRKVEMRRRRLLTAPVAIVVCLTADDLDAYPDADRRHAEWLTAEQSLGAAVQNLLLAGHAAGLGGCWICAPSFCEDTVRQALDLPASLAPRVLVLLGHPAVDPPVRGRRPVDDLVLRR